MRIVSFVFLIAIIIPFSFPPHHDEERTIKLSKDVWKYFSMRGVNMTGADTAYNSKVLGKATEKIKDFVRVFENLGYTLGDSFAYTHENKEKYLVGKKGKIFSSDCHYTNTNLLVKEEHFRCDDFDRLFKIVWSIHGHIQEKYGEYMFIFPVISPFERCRVGEKLQKVVVNCIIILYIEFYKYKAMKRTNVTFVMNKNEAMLIENVFQDLHHNFFGDL